MPSAGVNLTIEMQIPVLERSKYFRGLLVLIRKDQNIAPRERELILQIGSLLDFDPRFCEAAIDDVMKNPNITDEPVAFSDPQTAECFVMDAIRLACPSYNVHPHELAWLKAVAQANGLSDAWLDTQFQNFFEMRSKLALPEISALQRMGSGPG